jgi:oxygen-independent coproporphyrinogen-3 oxidase
MTGGQPESLRPSDVVSSFDGPAGAYVHIPFCEWICPFCPYNKVLARDDLAASYFAALRAEVDMYLDLIEAPFTSLYVGGGTPTLYPEQLAEVVGRIPVTGERAIEVLPLHGTQARLTTLRDIGFGAVSIGAQSFHDPVLRHLRRPHDAEQALAAVDNALGRFDCVDVDLIVDVALEETNRYPGAFLSDVRTCFAKGVDQVSTYPLMRFGYTPFGVARHDRRREHEILAQVTDLASAMGYERRSAWTFNRVGSAPYTSITRRRFLGFGAGASSFAGQDFYVNHFGLATYIASVAAGHPPIAKWLHLGRPAGMAYDTFWQAYAGTISPAALRADYGAWVGPLRAALTPLVASGLLTRHDGTYRLTARGFDRYHDLERWVTYHFIEPLWAEMLTEHKAEGSHVPWAETTKARSGRGWHATERLLNRPLRRAVG